jgi:hypothetical protein
MRLYKADVTGTGLHWKPLDQLNLSELRYLLSHVEAGTHRVGDCGDGNPLPDPPDSLEQLRIVLYAREMGWL